MTDTQLSFSSLDDAAKKKVTKREVFLSEMAAVVPWSALEAVIDPHYPKMGPQGGRRAPLFAPGDSPSSSRPPGAEEARYDSQSSAARFAV